MSATTDAGAAAGPVQNLRVLGVEVAEGLRAMRREPAALFFSVIMPVSFFGLFATMFGSQSETTGLPTAATMLATYGTFGAVSVMLIQPGVGVADDRTRGWLRMKKVSAAPISMTIAGKVIAALPYALTVLLGISAISLVVAGPVLGVGAWLRLVIVLLFGSLPFALLGLAVGFVASSNATVAILNAALAGYPGGTRVIVRRERPHPGAQLDAFEERDGWRYTAFATDTAFGQLARLDARHRAHARVEDRIRCAKDTGLDHFPSRSFAINTAWLSVVMLAVDLIAWTQHLLLHGDLARAEPKTLRYRLLHVAARLTRGQRRTWLRIQRSWPWARQLAAAFARLGALPVPAG